ncbi:MAG TPA: alpha/beta fold hydrolase [Herpetosiphonaceae bacterium]|nr:alpha/beta fold hydrolase [Herpetosiphonaceae bacterium]
MANIVIVHGAFGGGWEWREVAALLRARGHEVFTPSLTGFGERVHLATPQTGLETHMDDIVNVLRYEDLHEVVLACQSYGGMVATGVAGRIPERIAHLVYLNALVPEDGQSAFDLTPPAFRRRFEAGIRTTGEGWRIPVPSFENDPQIAAFARGRYVASPLRGFTDKIRLGAPPVGVQRTYIWCTEDQEGLAGVAEIMRPFAECARHDPSWRFHQLTAIPDAYIHAPETVADLFDEAARSSLGPTTK